MIIQTDDNRNITHRIGDHQAPKIFRSNRFYTIRSKWYFTTREGQDQGPYDSRIIAHLAIQEYIREMQSLVH